MPISYPTIAFHPEKCNGCNECMEACAKVHTDTNYYLHSRIQIIPDSVDNTYGIALCRQCSEPRCVMDCPAKALVKNEQTGVIEWLQDKCVNCQLCTLACSWAGITFNPVTNQVMKCDMCDGDPACVKVCQPQALQYINVADIYEEVGELEDLFVPGISACLGCNMELLIRHTLRRIGPNTIVATPPGCVAGVAAVGVNEHTATKVPTFHPLLTNTASMLAGIKRYYDRIGRDITMLAFGGDGGTADVGFQSLSGAAERGEKMIYICIDNEGYMNTGVQRSGTTPYGAWTSTTPVGSELRGKTNDAKQLPIIMMMHNCEYVATASLAFMNDFYEKLDKAVEASKHGMAYLHVFSPCNTGWRYPPDKTIELSRMAVETNMFPLWEYKNNQLTFTHPVDNPNPVENYLKFVGKFKHLDQHQIQRIKLGINRHISTLDKFIPQDQDKPNLDRVTT